MNKDQKTLEYLYEQVINEHARVLKLEVEYAKIIADHAIKDLTKSLEKRIQNNGKIKGERLIDLISPKVNQTSHLLKNEPTEIVERYTNIVRLDVFSTLIYCTARRAYNLKAEDIQVVVMDPTALVYIGGSSNKANAKSIRALDKEMLKKSIQKAIEDTFVVRYTEYLTDEKEGLYIPPIKKLWMKWRREKLNHENLTIKLPELKGIF